MRTRIGGALWLAVVILTMPACLKQETTHTVYIERDGTVTWSVMQHTVRSDGKTAADRTREEQDFLAAARRGDHPVGTAFWRLAPLDMRTDVLRSTTPFVVLTEARFARLDEVMDRVAAKAGAASTSTLVRRGGVVTWTWTVDDSGDDDVDRDKAIDALGDLFDGGRFVLAEGRFVSASGFTLSDDGRVAVLHVRDDRTGQRFELVWTEGDQSGAI